LIKKTKLKEGIKGIKKRGGKKPARLFAFRGGGSSDADR
jgi:hypothetical protein